MRWLFLWPDSLVTLPVRLVLAVCALLIGLRWHARRQARLWVDQLGPERLRDFLAGKADRMNFPTHDLNPTADNRSLFQRFSIRTP
jgi:hypothetical protein